MTDKEILSEQKYQELLNNFLGVLDTVYTLSFRYPQLICHDFLGHQDSYGPGLDFTSQNPCYAAITNTLILILGGIRLAYDYKNMKNEKQRISAHFYLKPPDLTSDSQSKKNLLEKTKDYADKIWGRFGYSSFVYWLLWVGTSLFDPTGYGLMSIPGWLVFGIPLFIGFCFLPLLNYVKWFFRNSNQQNSNQTENTQTIHELIDDKFKDKTLTKKIQNNNYTPRKISVFEKKINRIVKNKSLRLFATFLWNWVAFFAAAQYLGWILSDLFVYASGMSIAAPAVFAVFGLILTLSTIYAGYKTMQKHSEINNMQEKINNHMQTTNFDDLLKKENAVRKNRMQVEVEEVKQIPHFNKSEFFYNVNSNDFSAKRKYPYIRHAWNFINGFMGGIFMARVFLIPGTVLFMPFTVAALSGPFAIVILAALGITWGVFRAFYQENARKEKNAEVFLTTEKDSRMDILEKEYKIYATLFVENQTKTEVKTPEKKNLGFKSNSQELSTDDQELKSDLRLTCR